jgi:hypothetical protein
MFARAQSSAPLSGPYRIAGTVVNAVTGEPVHGAMVAILTMEDSLTFASTETDGEGHFALERLPAEKFQLTASKRGYRTSFFDEHEEFNSAIVTGEGQETGKLVFKLPPGAVLSGVVTGDGGDPVEGAELMLFKKPTGSGADAVPERRESETTDDTGAYEFSGLEAGTYLLAVQAEPWYAMHPATPQQAGAQETEQQAALDVVYPVTYFDSTADEASATPIELEDGGRQEANISLHAVPALHLRISLSPGPGTENLPIDVRPMVFGQAAPNAGYGRVPAGSGAVEIEGLAPGEYQIQEIDPARVVEMNLAASQQLGADAGAPTVEVKGLVEDARGAPLKDAMVTLSPARVPAGTAQMARTQQGAFTASGIPPGEWRVEVTAPAMGGSVQPVMSVTAGGKTQAGDRVTVGEQPLSLVVMVGTHAAHIEGFARKDGKGVGGVMVVLVPRDPAAMPSLVRRDQSDSDGSFNLLSVAPGAYTVVAIADGWGLDWADPRVMARYLPGGVTVTVKDEADNAPAQPVVQLGEAVPVQPR